MNKVHIILLINKLGENTNSIKIKDNEIVEIGPGNVLSSLNRRINKALDSISIENFNNIGDAVELISNER